MCRTDQTNDSDCEPESHNPNLEKSGAGTERFEECATHLANDSLEPMLRLTWSEHCRSK